MISRTIRLEWWCKAQHLHWQWCCIALIQAPKSPCRPLPWGKSMAGSSEELLFSPSAGDGSAGGGHEGAGLEELGSFLSSWMRTSCLETGNRKEWGRV